MHPVIFLDIQKSPVIRFASEAVEIGGNLYAGEITGGVTLDAELPDPVTGGLRTSTIRVGLRTEADVYGMDGSDLRGTGVKVGIYDMDAAEELDAVYGKIEDVEYSTISERGEIAGGAIVIETIAPEDLLTAFPPTIDPTTFPDSPDTGLTIPRVYNMARGVPLRLIREDQAAGEYDYLCSWINDSEKNAGGMHPPSAVWRGDESCTHEKFTAYTKTDTGSKLIVSKHKVEFNAIATRDGTACFLSRDKGVGNALFSGDFTVRGVVHIESITSSGGSDQILGVLTLCNTDVSGGALYNTSAHIMVAVRSTVNDSEFAFALYHYDGSTQGVTYGAVVLSPGTFYWKFIRDESYPGTTYGRYTLYIYSDEQEETLVDSIYWDITGGLVDWRYCHAVDAIEFASPTSASETVTGWCALLDVGDWEYEFHNGSASSARPNYPFIRFSTRQVDAGGNRQDLIADWVRPRHTDPSLGSVYYTQRFELLQELWMDITGTPAIDRGVNASLPAMTLGGQVLERRDAIDAILDFLYVFRAHMYIEEIGGYLRWAFKSDASTAAAETYGLGDGDAENIVSVDGRGVPSRSEAAQTLSINYGYGGAAGDYRRKLSRTVGSHGRHQDIYSKYLRIEGDVDACISYRQWKIETARRRMDITVMASRSAALYRRLGDVVVVRIPALGLPAELHASTISFYNGFGGADDEIRHAGNGILAAGFRKGDKVVISGSASNDGTVDAVAVSAGVIYVPSGTLTAEPEGANITLTEAGEWQITSLRKTVDPAAGEVKVQFGLQKFSELPYSYDPGDLEGDVQTWIA